MERSNTLNMRKCKCVKILEKENVREENKKYLLCMVGSLNQKCKKIYSYIVFFENFVTFTFRHMFNILKHSYKCTGSVV